MKKKILSVLFCAAMVTSMAVGCGSTSEETSGSEDVSGSEEQAETDEDSKDGTIYLLHKGLDYYAWTAMQEAFDKYVQDLGYDYQILNAENDISKQVEQFKTTLTQKPKAIIVTAIDSESLVDCVKEANDAGIPVGVYDTPITGGDVDITVDCDNKMAGQQAAEMIVEALKEKNGSESGKVLNVFGDLSSQVMQERKQGFDDVMAQYPDIEVIEASGMGDRLESQDATANALAANEDIDAIHAPCDNAFNGVYEAVESAGKLVKVGEEGHIIMVSIDGEPTTLDRITDDYMDGTVNLDWHAVAAICLEMMDKYVFTGEDIPDTYEAADSYFEFDWDSTEIKEAADWNGPWISLPTHKVDKENAQDPNNSGRYSADVLGIDY